MKHIKKIISLMLAFALVLTLALMPAAAIMPGVTIKETVSGLDYDSIQPFSGGLAMMVYKDGKIGFIDKTGELVIPLIYKDARNFGGGLIHAAVGEWPNIKWGLIDITGKEVVPLIYDYIFAFLDDWAVAQKDGKFGFIDKTGKEIVPCIYDNAQPFSEGLAPVRIGDWETGKWGYINIAGEEIIPFIYTGAGIFSNGLAPVQKDGKFGYIDTAGSEVIPFIYDELDWYFHDDGVKFMQKDGMWGLTDMTGNELTGFIYEAAASWGFVEGMAWVGQFMGTPDQREINQWRHFKYGFIDKTGREVIPLEYTVVEHFSDGLARVGEFEAWWGGTLGGPEYKYGYIDKTGKLVIPFAYDNAASFSEGFAVVGNVAARNSLHGRPETYSFGVIDKRGSLIVPMIYDSISDFSGGLAAAQKDGVWSVLQIIYPEIGAPLGDVLYTDIIAYINGEAIPSYNIDGNTFIIAEDLMRYGFNVAWDGEERTLKVLGWNANKAFDPIPAEKETAASGAFKTNYFYTDIKTFVSGEEAEGFNIDGQTLIHFDLLAEYGMVEWDAQARELRLVIG
jgi:hypothetical protein